MLFLQVVLALLSLACVVSMGAYMLSACWSKSPTLFSVTLSDTKFSLRQIAFLIFAGLGLCVCIFQGVEAMLYPLPEAWGSIDEYGEFKTFRVSTALLFAAVAVGWIAFVSKASYYSEMHKIMLKEIQGLEKILKGGNSVNTLDSLRDEFKGKSAELKDKRAQSGRNLGRYELVGSGPYDPVHPEDEEAIMYYRLIDAVNVQKRILSESAAEKHGI